MGAFVISLIYITYSMMIIKIIFILYRYQIKDFKKTAFYTYKGIHQAIIKIISIRSATNLNQILDHKIMWIIS